MKFRWTPAPPQPLLAGQLARGLKIPALLAQCMLNRDLSQPEAINAFLQPKLKDLADPFRLPNMETAVNRLFQARERKEPLVIFGDYDVDGVTSTALLLEVFRTLGWTANCYLPNRMDEGYGLSQDALENCLKKFSSTLLLAVDCGSATPGPIAWLRERGVDVIVLDHHQVSSPPPDATALVNPQLGTERGHSCPPESVEPHGGGQECPRSELKTEFTELCSAGLAFKLAHALVKRGRETGLPGAAQYDLRTLLDLVALGTVADLVPLTGENRRLVSAGLDRLSWTLRPGLVALKQVAQCGKAVGAYETGFQLAPRLNAAGRLETAEDSLHLLMARSVEEALPLARTLDAHNRERQRIERAIVDEVSELVRAKFNAESDYVIVEGSDSWHIGVVGIVAARVLRQFHRPTIIVGGDGDEWRGSGRSIAGFDLAAALRECSDLLVRHGGHAMAAGLTIQRGKLNDFRARFNTIARRALPPEALQPSLRLDAETGLDEMTIPCLKDLERLGPVGQGNPAVQFFTRNLAHQRPLQRIGADKQHVKLWVTDGITTHEAVWWGAGNESLPVGRFDLAFAPQVNEFNGRRTVQLKVLDWRAATP